MELERFMRPVKSRSRSEEDGSFLGLSMCFFVSLGKEMLFIFKFQDFVYSYTLFFL